MENPTNYNDAINDDSSYLFSVGFDLPGELKMRAKSVSDILKVLSLPQVEEI